MDIETVAQKAQKNSPFHLHQSKQPKQIKYIHLANPEIYPRVEIWIVSFFNKIFLAPSNSMASPRICFIHSNNNMQYFFFYVSSVFRTWAITVLHSFHFFATLYNVCVISISSNSSSVITLHKLISCLAAFICLFNFLYIP